MKRSTEALMQRLDIAVSERRGDWSAKADTGAEAAWGATVRVTQYPNVRGAPDRSTAYYQTGSGTAEDALEPALRAALADVERWDVTEPRPATWEPEATA